MSLFCVSCKSVRPNPDFSPSQFKVHGRGARCRSCMKKAHANWRIKDPDRYKRMYEKVNRKRLADPAFRQAMTDKMNERNRALRNSVFSCLGDMCMCCKESNRKFLQVDHVNNDGWTKRKYIKSQYQFYKSIVAGKTDGLQLLCANCNWGKARNKGVCPHEEERMAAALLCA